MLKDLILRFVLGGTIVSLFAVLADVFEPKTFSGLFGAAPSVALLSLALAYGKQGAAYVEHDARAMTIGGFALVAYGSMCQAMLRWRRVPVWLSAGLNWVVWLAAAILLRGLSSWVGIQ